jgi:N-acetylmuramoyl-L-alanine amidase
MAKITKEQFNSAISAVAGRAKTGELTAAAESATRKLEALTKSVVGRTAEETINNIKSLTQEDDYGNPLAPGTGIATIDQGADATLAGTYSNDAAAITGAGETAGPKFEIAGGNSPKAILKSLEQATGKAATEFKAIAASMTTSQNAAEQSSAIDAGETDFTALSGSLFTEVSNFTRNIDAAVGTDAQNVLESIISQTSGDNRDKLIALSQGSLTPKKISNILNKLSEATRNARLSAVNDLASELPGLDRSQIEDTVNSVDMSVSAQLRKSPRSDAFGTSALPVFTIGEAASLWEGIETPIELAQPSRAQKAEDAFKGTANASKPQRVYTFSFVNSEEELEAEFRSTTREITEVVIHWSATFLDQDWGSEEMHKIHTQRGFSGIGYHYVIRKDGRLQRGRPVDNTGAHAKDNGHNKYSIGISLIGGYNCMANTPNADKYVSSASLNEKQMETLEKFMRTFYLVWPGGQAWGHVDTDRKGKVDPGFDVPDFVKVKFGKQNVSSSGQERPKSAAEIQGLLT